MVIEITQGAMIGNRAGAGQSVNVFKGIPYAAPPLGELRWKPPEPAAGWTSPRPATEFSPGAMQQPYPPDSFYARLFPARNASEDCLYLNVWTPDTTRAVLPVMLWLHGGALTRGSGALDYYAGANLAEKGVVVVTLNYRLGVFGFFAHPQLVDESAQQSAGNYGILDQIQALRWLRENIAAFGGDPENVTIFGQSAGAWSVSVLSASPLADGLFHKAVGQSGGRLDPRPELASAIEAGFSMGEAIGAPTLAELRALPADRLLAAADAAGFQSNDIVDGWVLPEQPYAIFAAGRQSRVPVLLGFNKDEGSTLNASALVAPNEDVYVSYVRDNYGSLADEYLAAYPADALHESTLAAFRDYWFGWQALAWAGMTDNVAESSFVYFFAHAPPGPQRAALGAYHAAEIPYVFGNVNVLRDPATDADRRLAEIMSNYWVAFARTGVPAVDGQPTWPKFNTREASHLVFTEEGTAQPASRLLGARWTLWDKILNTRRG